MGSLFSDITKSVARRLYSLADLERDMDRVFHGKPSKTGMHINEAAALHSVAVWACIRLLSETLASLPLIMYKRLDSGKERATEHPLYKILHDQPNTEMTSYYWRETQMGHVVGWGNAFAEIEYEGSRVKHLWPLMPDKMREIKRDPTTGRLWYYYLLPNGETIAFPNHKVLHIPGLGFNGITGYTPIEFVREAVGLALGAEDFGARFFGNDASPGGVLEHPGTLSDPAKKQLREQWEEMHKGLDRSHRTAILEEGMTFKQMGIPPKHAQFLETRKFQRNEIATFYHIPPHMIGDLERATFSNIEQQSLEFITYTMRPWLVKWEQQLTKQLIPEDEMGRYFIEFNVDGVLRGDAETRANYYNQMFMVGAMSQNDIREKENMNPIEGGDVYYVQSAMMPAGGEEEEPPQPPPEPEPEDEDEDEFEGLDQSWIDILAPIMYDAMARTAEHERRTIARQAKKVSDDELRSWLPDFYNDFSEVVARNMLPVIDAVGGNANDFVCRYIEESLGMFDAAPVSARISDWVEARVSIEDARDEIKHMLEVKHANTDTK